MKKLDTLIAASAFALLLSGNVFAASLQPAAGDGAYPPEPAMSTSQVDRQAVQAAAVEHPHAPAAGEQKAHSDQAASGTVPPTRAEVIRATQQAINAGQFPASGEH